MTDAIANLTLDAALDMSYPELGVILSNADVDDADFDRFYSGLAGGGMDGRDPAPGVPPDLLRFVGTVCKCLATEFQSGRYGAASYHRRDLHNLSLLRSGEWTELYP